MARTLLELTHYKEFNVNKLEKLVSKAWPNITFEGRGFFDGGNNYYDELDKLVAKRFDDHEMQESYAGWIQGTDRFIACFDAWGSEAFDDDYEEDYTFSLVLEVVWTRSGLGLRDDYEVDGLVYDSGGGYSHVHKKYKNLVDLRLD